MVALYVKLNENYSKESELTEVRKCLPVKINKGKQGGHHLSSVLRWSAGLYKAGLVAKFALKFDAYSLAN